MNCLTPTCTNPAFHELGNLCYSCASLHQDAYGNSPALPRRGKEGQSTPGPGDCAGQGLRGHKYNAQPTGGYPSKAQAKRAAQLKLMERAGTITNLREEVPYPLAVNDFLICTYRADFVYREGGVEVVEDVKGVRTPTYKLKKRLMFACYGIEIREEG